MPDRAEVAAPDDTVLADDPAADEGTAARTAAGAAAAALGTELVG
jgi:hypothetical protein